TTPWRSRLKSVTYCGPPPTAASPVATSKKRKVGELPAPDPSPLAERGTSPEAASPGVRAAHDDRGPPALGASERQREGSSIWYSRYGPSSKRARSTTISPPSASGKRARRRRPRPNGGSSAGSRSTWL